MKILFSSENLKRLKTPVLVIGVFKDSLDAEQKKLDTALNSEISNLVKTREFKAEPNQTIIFPTLEKIGAKHLLLVGLGKKQDFNLDTIRQASAAAVQQAKSSSLKSITIQLPDLGAKHPISDVSQATVEGAILGLYAFDTYITESREKLTKIDEITLWHGYNTELEKAKKPAQNGQILADIINYSRELANLPANMATPAHVAEEAVKLGKKHKFKVIVYDLKGIQRLGFGGLLAVSTGSGNEPKLIIMKYQGIKGSDKPLVLVGKTITFDSGGLNIKTGDYMNNMKFDKCGGISVLGTIAAAAALKLPVNLVGIMPATDNMPSGKAYKVGDIIKTWGGKTIEIGNTDAEGRVAISDSLSYTKEFKPKAVIDLATLTGSIIAALGNQAAGLFGTDQTLINMIKKASERTGDRVWELPLWNEYDEQIKSDFADVKNIGSPGGAGAITAAAFLKKFLPEKIPWAHMDIAGVAWTEKGKYKPYYGKGATGFGIRLLIDLIQNWK